MSTVMGNAPAGAAEPPPAQHGAPPVAARGANAAHAPNGRTCANCGNPLAPEQDWCTQCGAGAPGSIHNPPWRSTTAIAAAVAALALGAAAAAYAALNEHTPKRRTVTEAVALASVPAKAPTTTTPKAALNATRGTAKLPIPLIKTKLPKIPLPAITAPKGNKTQPASKTNPSTKEGTGKGESTGGTETSEPAAILLDTNAASTYNPYNLPASYFGDPSVTIDGDTSTAWSAEVDPATAPNMAEGVLLDLKSLQSVAVLKLVTHTPGMTVQVYGSTAATPPDSIVDPEWTPLSAPRVVAKHDTKIKLRDHKKGFRYITLWISKAPKSAVGTPTAPGDVLVNELELFPPASST